ncbi:MAG: hypothetical protein Q8L29_01105 [archaeon]|nr:hypothetical protein [archaeon]
MELKQALAELRKLEKRKFEQGIDLIVNLKGIDVRKDNISAIITLPHKIKDKNVCGFLTKKSELVTTITQPDFARYKDKKELKNLVKRYDFFIGAAPLMPSVATVFGKALGPAGKMPSPQLGIIAPETDATIKNVLDKIDKSIKIRAKEASIKVIAGKENMDDEQIIENIRAIYGGIVEALPTKKENVKSVMIKLTMSKPIKVEIK